MKKIIWSIAIISTMFLVACNKTDVSTETSEITEDTVNDVTEEGYSEEATDDIEVEDLTEDTTEEDTILSEDITSDVQLDLELKPTDNSRIAELLNVSGSYTDSVGNVDNYIYQIPQFNADSESAKAVNGRIVEDIQDNIYDEFVCMSEGYSLFCYSITYEVIENGDIVAIIISAPYPNDCMQYYIYSYDFGLDKEVTNKELLAMFEWTEEEFIEEALRREREYFEGQIKSMYPDISEGEMNEYMASAITETTVDLPMYIGTDGMLYVYIPMPSLAGADWYYSLESF